MEAARLVESYIFTEAHAMSLPYLEPHDDYAGPSSGNDLKLAPFLRNVVYTAGILFALFIATHVVFPPPLHAASATAIAPSTAVAMH